VNGLWDGIHLHFCSQEPLALLSVSTSDRDEEGAKASPNYELCDWAEQAGKHLAFYWRCTQ
jgi:hypothetical protein